MYADYFHISPGRRRKGPFADFGRRRSVFERNTTTELVQDLRSGWKRKDFPAGTLGERESRAGSRDDGAALVHPEKYSGFRSWCGSGLSGLPLEDHYRLGQLIRRAVEETGRRAVYVASGDLSHKLQAYGPYGYAPEGPQYDARIMDVCGRAAFGELFDFDEAFCERAAECGHRSFVIMAGALDGVAVTAEQLSHEDVTGVGYGICAFHPGDRIEAGISWTRPSGEAGSALAEQRNGSDPYVQLAWQSVESWVHRKDREGSVAGGTSRRS